MHKRTLISDAPYVVSQGLHYGKAVLEIIRLLRLWKRRITKRIRRVKGAWAILKKFVSEVKKKY